MTSNSSDQICSPTSHIERLLLHSDFASHRFNYRPDINHLFFYPTVRVFPEYFGTKYRSGNIFKTAKSAYLEPENEITDFIFNYPSISEAYILYMEMACDIIQKLHNDNKETPKKNISDDFFSDLHFFSFRQMLRRKIFLVETNNDSKYSITINNNKKQTFRLKSELFEKVEWEFSEFFNKLKPSIFNISKMEIDSSRKELVTKYKYFFDHKYFPFDFESDDKTENNKTDFAINIATFLSYLCAIQILVMKKIAKRDASDEELEQIVRFVSFLKKMRSSLFFIKEPLLELFKDTFGIKCSEESKLDDYYKICQDFNNLKTKANNTNADKTNEDINNAGKNRLDITNLGEKRKRYHSNCMPSTPSDNKEKIYVGELAFSITFFYDIIFDVSHFPKISLENEGITETALMKFIIKHLPDQKYINSYAIPLMLFYDFNEEAQKAETESFWNSYVSSFSSQIYTHYKYRASSMFLKLSIPSGGETVFDYSPLLTEQMIFLTKNNNFFNLSESISDFLNKLINVNLEFCLMLVSDDSKVNSKSLNIQGFKFVADLISVLRHMIHLLFKDGANIEPLSVLSKYRNNFENINEKKICYRNFKNICYQMVKSRIRPVINYQYVHCRKCFIVGNNEELKYEDFRKNLLSIVSQGKLVGNLLPPEIKEEELLDLLLFGNISGSDSPNRIDLIKTFFDEMNSQMKSIGIDQLANVFTIIGYKRMKKIVRFLIEEVKEILQKEFIKNYGLFIPSFRFNLDFDEKQSLSNLQDHCDSMVTYLLMPKSIPVIESIAKIGNIIALISIIDSTITTEKLPDDLITLAMNPRALNGKLIQNNDYVPLNLKADNELNPKHNYFADVCREIYSILNANFTLFEKNRNHAGFYEYASILIYAAGMNFHNTQNDDLIQSDGIFVATSIMIELLAQYDLYAQNGLIERFLMKNEFSEGNNNIRQYNKLQISNEIVAIFHYSLYRASFPSPNVLIHSDWKPSDSLFYFIQDLFVKGTKKVALLFTFPSNCTNKEKEKSIGRLSNILKCNMEKSDELNFVLKRIESEKVIHFAVWPISDISQDNIIILKTPIMDIFELSKGPSENAIIDDNEENVKNLKANLPNENGEFLLLTIRERAPLGSRCTKEGSDDLKYLNNLHKNFPVCIKDCSHYLYPQKLREPAPNFATGKDYVYL